ncbi:TIGR03013 family XrtA/PEP-CTERM system glycosyltransferase [Desulforhopalus sp. IMCC35007]|uniref:TIGR03013 family XrtA/PEP-CTERM system glycosyltransferase n=1 Tax=Desulforhopalus sp. IMCC35007 TaxID=2569543 RepID=UPI00145CBE4A|nr:TIGR03013 family XrtA/PEP-CTERM system glycosyltransferase [Desulforhopalus sp. IMCC35007]
MMIFSSILFSCLIFVGMNQFISQIALYCSQALLVTSVFQLCLYFFDMYEMRQDLSMLDNAIRLTQAFGVGCILLGLLYYIFPYLWINTYIFWTGYVLVSFSLLFYRYFYHRILRRRMFAQDLVLIGTGELASEIAKEIEGRHNSVYRILAFVGDSSPIYNPYHVPVFKKIEDVENILPLTTIQRIIVAPDDKRGGTPIRTLLKCKLAGTIVEQGVPFYERITGKIMVEKVDPSWIVFSDGFTVISRWRYLVKRLVDVVLSGGLLFLNAPVMLVSAIIIKLESPGPVFYLQERVGEGNVPFKVIKFRSMGQDAEKDGAVWAQKNDSRVTRFGGFIRKVRIDELPQLWNVLKGEMSLVGPRPERQVFVDQLVEEIPYYGIRHVVKPGITGWAQVSYPYGASKQDALRKLEYDLFYIKNNSIALDLLVIFYTVKTVLFGKGGR